MYKQGLKTLAQNEYWCLPAIYLDSLHLMSIANDFYRIERFYRRNRTKANINAVDKAKYMQVRNHLTL